MKNILFILFTMSFGFFLKGQNPILPLDAPIFNISQGAYKKDTQNQLNPFLGTWTYTQGNKKVTIKFTKVMYNFGNYFKDIIYGTYKVEENGQVLYNDFGVSADDSKIFGTIFHEGKYWMYYIDSLNCDVSPTLNIWKDPNDPNKLIWRMFFEEGAYPGNDNCPEFQNDNENFGQSLTLPWNMTLTKFSNTGNL